MAYILVSTEYDFTVIRNNDTTVSFSISAGAAPYNLTSATMTFFLKANAAALDSGGYSTTPTVTAALLGQFSVSIPKAQLATAGTLFYHVDSVISSANTTLVYGTVTIIAV